jgi:hypothetical protein
LTLGFAGACKNILQKNKPVIIAVDGFKCACAPKTMKESLGKEGYNDALRAEFVLKSEAL